MNVEDNLKFAPSSAFPLTKPPVAPSFADHQQAAFLSGDGRPKTLFVVECAATHHEPQL